MGQASASVIADFSIGPQSASRNLRVPPSVKQGPYRLQIWGLAHVSAISEISLANLFGPSSLSIGRRLRSLAKKILGTRLARCTRGRGDRILPDPSRSVAASSAKWLCKHHPGVKSIAENGPCSVSVNHECPSNHDYFTTRKGVLLAFPP